VTQGVRCVSRHKFRLRERRILSGRAVEAAKNTEIPFDGLRATLGYLSILGAASDERTNGTRP